MKKRKVIIFVLILVLCAVVISGCSSDGTNEWAEGEDGDAGPLAQLLGSRSQSLQIVGILTILSLAPSILIMLSGFVRIIIVLSFARQAIGLQQMPPNQVVIVLALFLTLLVMMPTLTEINEEAIQPYINEDISFDEAIENAEAPLREFMLAQTFKDDLNMFVGFNYDEENPIPEDYTLDDVPMSTVIPAFLTSEIKRAFTMGFFIYIPFIVIDLVVASVLMSMGMMMLPPVMISLPFKVLLFVLVDGWTLTIQTLVSGFN